MENKINLDLFNPKKAELTEIAAKYKDLTINGVDDKEGFKAVHAAQMELRGLRLNIQNTRKDYTRQFDDAKKQAMDLEKELLGIITPLEDSLKEQKEKIEAEKERIKQEELEEKRKFLQGRVDQLFNVGYAHHDLHELSQMGEDDFQSLLEEKTLDYTHEQKKIQEEKDLARKNEIRSYILRANTVEALEVHVKDMIKENGFDFLEFEQEFESKKKMIIQQEELEEKQRKIDEENKKIQDEKDKLEREKQEKIESERKERINGLRRELMQCGNLEELKKAFNGFAPLDKEALEYDFETLSNKLIKEEEDARKKKAEDELLEKQKQEKLEKEKKYKDFLKKNEGNFDGFFDKDGERVLYKIVDKFKI